MPAYDDRLFSPAAPVVHARLRRSPAEQTQIDIAMLIDSGADVTLVPKSAVDSLGLELSATKYELIAFDGARSVSEAVQAEIVLLGRIFRGQFLLLDQETGVLGRDILNHLRILLDGPDLQWEEQGRAWQ
jgi:predicted aspartyl protease